MAIEIELGTPYAMVIAIQSFVYDCSDTMLPENVDREQLAQNIQRFLDTEHQRLWIEKSLGTDKIMPKCMYCGEAEGTERIANPNLIMGADIDWKDVKNHWMVCVDCKELIKHQRMLDFGNMIGNDKLTKYAQDKLDEIEKNNCPICNDLKYENFDACSEECSKELTERMNLRKKNKNEKRILKEIEEMGGRWELTHKSEYDGKRQSVAVIKANNKYGIGHALLSRKDVFNKRIGREIALGRALIMIKDKPREIKDVPNEMRFKEDMDT